MPSAMPSEVSRPPGVQDKQWADYNRAITAALREKQDNLEAPKGERATILRAIDHIAKAVGSSLADPAILGRLCAALRSVVGADFSYTIGFDPETQTCHTLGGDELEPARVVTVFDAKHARAQILESLPALAAGDKPEIDPGDSIVPIAELYRTLGFRRVLHLPLFRGRELGGVQLVGRRASREAFDATALAILDGAAPTAALTLEIDRTRRQLARSEQVSHYVAAGISHELRNTFSVIIGYGEILRDKARSGAAFDGANSAMIERLYSAACEGLESMRPAFELSNPLGEATPLEIEDVSVGDLIEDLVGEHFAQQRPEVDLRSDIDPALPTVRTDPMKLRLILEQILSNAQKFTAAGDVAIVAKTDADKGVVIAISDTGPGISRERLATSFDALAEPGPASASGLGLHICKKLARKIGATLDVESELGKGTTVRVTLPLN